jgi:hypothetical protein
MTPERKRMSRIAAMYGYKVQETTLPATDFQAGDGVIVLDSTGQPVVSGTVEEVNDGTGVGGQQSLRVNGQWYYDDSFKFRAL